MRKAQCVRTRKAQCVRTRYAHCVLVAVVLLSSATYFFSGMVLPFLDLPSHVARCVVMDQLWRFDNAALASIFSARPVFAPYYLGDALLVGLLRIFSIAQAERVWVFSAWLGIPLGAWALAAAFRMSGISTIMGLLAGCLISSNWFFMNGFLHYQFGMGILLLTLAAWKRFCATGTMVSFASYAIGVVACYWMHASALVFLCVGLGVFGSVDLVRKRLSAATFVSVIPLLVLGGLLMNQGLVANTTTDQDRLVFRTVKQKLLGFAGPFIRFSPLWDVLLFGSFFAIIAFAILMGASRRQNWRQRIATPQAGFLLFCITFLGCYLVLPAAIQTVDDIDNRALPLAYLGLALGAPWDRIAAYLRKRKLRTLQFALPVVFAALPVADLCYTALQTAKLQPFLKNYQVALEQIPAHKSVLPVATIPDAGRIQFSLHLGDRYVVTGNGMTPYLFSGNNGDAQFYFRYHTTPIRPPLFWYLRDIPVRWEHYRDQFDYVIVTKPFERSRIEMFDLEVFYENEAAIVFHNRSKSEQREIVPRSEIL